MKLHTLYREYQTTEVLEGSPYAFFFLFWFTKLLTLVQRKSEWFNNVSHKIYSSVSRSEFVIKNNGGVFVVQPFDDSTTICADYFERDIRDWLLTPAVKNVFVDIGANRGIYSIRAPQKYGYQTVHALEPNKEMFDVLARNIQLNNLEEIVTCHNLAAGKETSTAHFSVDPMHKGGGKIVSATDSDTFDVSVASLDTILQAFPAQEISFIKIDTEGFEFDVLAGMSVVLDGMTDGACIMIETTELTKLVGKLAPFGFTYMKSQSADHLFIKKVNAVDYSS